MLNPTESSRVNTPPVTPGSRTTHGRGRNTQEFADDNLVKAQSVRKQYSKTGSYHGQVPVKLPNGRLKWPEKG
jgi:hypothetical protein